MAKQSILREFWLFIKHEKKWWLIPLFVIGIVLGAILLLSQSAPWLAPFIYPLF